MDTLSGDLEFDLLEWLQPSHIQTLIECFMDTFESNKLDAFKILSSIPTKYLFKEVSSIFDSGFRVTYFDSCKYNWR